MKKLFSAQYGNITFSYVFSLNSMKKTRGIIKPETRKPQHMKRKEGKIMKKTGKEMQKKGNENPIMNVTRYIPGCTNEHQRASISEHPFQIGNMVVVDQLETKGILRIFKPEKEKPVHFQPTDSGYFITGADLVGEISVFFMKNENAVLVNEIFSEKGYENLKKAMLEQVDYVADFYLLDKLGIMDPAYQK